MATTTRHQTCADCKSPDLRHYEGQLTCFMCGLVVQNGCPDFVYDYHHGEPLPTTRKVVILQGSLCATSDNTTAIRRHVDDDIVSVLSSNIDADLIEEFAQSLVEEARSLMDRKMFGVVRHAVYNALLMSKHKYRDLVLQGTDIRTVLDVPTKAILYSETEQVPQVKKTLAATMGDMFVNEGMDAVVCAEVEKFAEECEWVYRHVSGLDSFGGIECSWSTVMTKEFYFIEALFFLKKRGFDVVGGDRKLVYFRGKDEKSRQIHLCLMNLERESNAVWGRLVKMAGFKEAVGVRRDVDLKGMSLYQRISGSSPDWLKGMAKVNGKRKVM